MSEIEEVEEHQHELKSNFESDLRLNTGKSGHLTNKKLNKESALTVKQHITKVIDEINQVKTKLTENKQIGESLQKEHVAIENKISNVCQNVLDSLATDLQAFTIDFSRIIKADLAETNFIKQQIKLLTNDKMQLKKQVDNLESRFNSCVMEVGLEENIAD